MFGFADLLDKERLEGHFHWYLVILKLTDLMVQVAFFSDFVINFILQYSILRKTINRFICLSAFGPTKIWWLMMIGNS